MRANRVGRCRVVVLYLIGGPVLSGLYAATRPRLATADLIFARANDLTRRKSEDASTPSAARLDPQRRGRAAPQTRWDATGIDL